MPPLLIRDARSTRLRVTALTRESGGMATAVKNSTDRKDQVLSMTQRVQIDALGRNLDLEYTWVGPASTTDPVIVFLHEGLGNVSLWRDFPKQLCEALGFRGLGYSRYGYGRSTPRSHDERFPSEYLLREAAEVLPALLDTLGVRGAWLFGHSNGGTIALLLPPVCRSASGGLWCSRPTSSWKTAFSPASSRPATCMWAHHFESNSRGIRLTRTLPSTDGLISGAITPSKAGTSRAI